MKKESFGQKIERGLPVKWIALLVTIGIGAFCWCLKIEPFHTVGCCKNATGMSVNEMLLSGGISFLWAILAALLVWILMEVLKLIPSISSLKKLGVFALIWFAGFVAYGIGACEELHGYDGSLAYYLAVVPLVIIHTISMFVGHCDLDAIAGMRDNNAFMIFFSVTHFAAVVFTFSLILQQFGFYLFNEVAFWWRSHVLEWKFSKAKDLYVFWGVNERSLQLAKSVKQNMDPRSRMVFVRTFDDDESCSSHVGFSHIFEMIKMRDKEMDELKELDCPINTSFSMLAKADIENCDAKGHIDILDEQLELQSLTRMVRAVGGNVHFFFLNDDEDLNIKCVNNLMLDSSVNAVIEQADARIIKLEKERQKAGVIKTIDELKVLKKKAQDDTMKREIGAKIKELNGKREEYIKDIQQLKKGRKEIHIYCHARHSAKTRGLEVWDVINHNHSIFVHIIDSSQLSVFHLKSRQCYHPANLVKIEPDATVAEPFRAAVVGFGETGQEAFKFLYEFCAFADKKGNRSPFHCAIIDKKADELQGLFYTKAPAMRATKDADHCFLQYDAGSAEYWQRMEEEVRRNLNCLFITIDNDDVAIDTAITFCNLAVRWMKEKQKIQVYIRCYGKENHERLSGVIEKLKDSYADMITIIPFGNIEDIFTYEKIVNNDFEANAKQYNYVYSEENPDLKAGVNQDDVEERWVKELKFDYAADYGTIWAVEDTERLRDQNICNALHADTKRILLHEVKKNTKKVPKDYWSGLHLERDSNAPTTYIGTAKDDEAILINVAKCEHLRWIAASKLQGWQQTREKELCDDNKDTRRKIHIDLVPWDEIRGSNLYDKEQTQGYDCKVVDTTINMW